MNTNILVDKLPTTYKGLKVNTNFRSFILFELLMQDNEIPKEEKVYLALNLFYKEEIKDVKTAIDGIMWFYCMGTIRKENKNIKKKENKNTINNIYSYEYDAEYIYGAFWHDYRLDLSELDYLHWWKFKSLFDSLNEGNKICQIMSYRAVDLNKIKDENEKKKYRKLKQIWALPDNRTEKEKENDFAEALW